jgi:hypothetical protein
MPSIFVWSASNRWDDPQDAQTVIQEPMMPLRIVACVPEKHFEAVSAMSLTHHRPELRVIGLGTTIHYR